MEAVFHKFKERERELMLEDGRSPTLKLLQEKQRRLTTEPNSLSGRGLTQLKRPETWKTRY
ncbi:hypothetical protein HBH98_007880 [Parastagonospora nodorum]|uniref:Uncharacterized protein n=1 Tax=Phaeosphaeria nodorum (strain SN15 / ATCC MYA-4574 / FGSC 10173) TaxID=321614 RepID=A0A7U2I1X6_PHANO|nr:hypothetical protein HBH54_169400 [Parastagonospora nodorum]QRC96402.1 hypothetical protein JI435_408920 [Parastagonospora nodorum SN15]KAH3982311.1 hypothetical protein HBH52_074860 [Parastagonospora nodorum]KAH4041221.1 hypothetical protein HBI09_019710 [Parastagonospora nodorum]KAH4058227.1 hypothetical protein HBH49_030360 [Parastagonospora nodorum]